MRSLTIAILLCLPAAALATKPAPPKGGNSSAIAGAGAYAGAHAGAHASNKLTVNVNTPVSPDTRAFPTVSAAGGRGGVGQGGNATAAGGDSDQKQQQQQDTDQANSQTVNAGPSGNIDDTYEDFVSAAYAPSVQPTVPCLLPMNGGIVLPAVGSLSAGSGTIDVECERRETARIGLGSADPQTRQMANTLMQNMLRNMIQDTQPRAVEVSQKTIESNRSTTSLDEIWGY